MPSRAAAERSLTHDVPPTLLMHGVFWMYGKSFSRIAPMQKSATSARAMEPASPSMTLITPVGFSTVRPPGRTMHHSRSRPTPPSVKRASWLFLSVKMDLCGNQPSGAHAIDVQLSTQRRTT